MFWKCFKTWTSEVEKMDIEVGLAICGYFMEINSIEVYQIALFDVSMLGHSLTF